MWTHIPPPSVGDPLLTTLCCRLPPHSLSVFPPDPEGKLNTFIPRLLYCLINGGGLAFAGYRINQMGLLPTHLSDWVSSIKAPQVREAGGLVGAMSSLTFP